MFKSVKTRFIVFSMIFIVLSVGVPSLFLLYQFKENFSQRSEIMLETTGDVIKNCIQRAMMAGDKDIDKIVDRYTSNPHIDQIMFFNERGMITHASNRQQIERSVFDYLTGVDSSALDIIPYINQNRITGKVSIIEKMSNEPGCQSCHGNSAVIGYFYVESQMTQAESYFYTGSLHIFFLAGAIALIIFLGFFFLFSHYINQPLYQVIDAMDKVEEGHLKTRLPFKKEDEFGIVFRHFNQMTETLQQNRDQIDNLHFTQLQRADKLITLGELAAEMAHEINNPIGVIMTRADYLSMEAEDNSVLRQYNEDFEAIQKQVTRISGITGSILKYGKKLPKNYHETDLSIAIDESLKMLDPRIRKKKIFVTKDIQVKQPIILGDQQQMEQVFTNLINNALDAMEKDGKLELKISKNDSSQISISIRDDGTGIDRQQVEQIFTPFYSTKSADKGTGLGLYIVRKIVQNHNGTIECNSQPGVGATFNLTFKPHKEMNEKNSSH